MLGSCEFLSFLKLFFCFPIEQSQIKPLMLMWEYLFFSLPTINGEVIWICMCMCVYVSMITMLFQTSLFLSVQVVEARVFMFWLCNALFVHLQSSEKVCEREKLPHGMRICNSRVISTSSAKCIRYIDCMCFFSLLCEFCIFASIWARCCALAEIAALYELKRNLLQSSYACVGCFFFHRFIDIVLCCYSLE